MKHIESIRKAIREMHKCDAHHVKSVPVHESFQGETAWKGTVEVFNLVGHEKAKRAYAWQYQDDPNEIKTIVVLEIPPVDSAESAVKVAIAAIIQTKSKKPLTVTEFAQMGGFARARKLSKERQREIARKAGLASAETRRRAENGREA